MILKQINSTEQKRLDHYQCTCPELDAIIALKPIVLTQNDSQQNDNTNNTYRQHMFF